MLTEKWNNLLSVGVDNRTDETSKREIRMLNAMSFIAICINFILSFSWIYLGIYKYSAINYAMSVAMIGVFVLNKTGNVNIAKGFFFITLLIQIAFISILFDFRSEYYLFPLIVIAGFIFQKKKHLLFFVLLTLMVYLLMTGDFIFPRYIEFRREHSPMVNFMDGAIAIAFTVFALNQFLIVVESNRREIVVKNKLLEEAVNIAKERAEYSELLLKEMNHRIKNNLQMISSLLSIHAERSPSKKAQKALLDAQSRIFSIALIHRQLYIEDNLTKIDIAKYIDELIPVVKESFPLMEDMLQIKSLCSHISLDIEEAVLVGLILNELITNSVKHGAIKGNLLIVKILAYFNNNDHLYISVEHDGNPLKEEDLLNSKNFGMDLVIALASSLDGKIMFDQEFNRVAFNLRVTNNSLDSIKNEKSYE